MKKQIVIHCPFCKEMKAYFYNKEYNYPEKVKEIDHFKCHGCQKEIKFRIYECEER